MKRNDRMYAKWLRFPNNERRPMLLSESSFPYDPTDYPETHNIYYRGRYTFGTLAEYVAEDDAHLRMWLDSTGQTHITL